MGGLRCGAEQRLNVLGKPSLRLLLATGLCFSTVTLAAAPGEEVTTAAPSVPVASTRTTMPHRAVSHRRRSASRTKPKAAAPAAPTLSSPTVSQSSSGELPEGWKQETLGLSKSSGMGEAPTASGAGKSGQKRGQVGNPVEEPTPPSSQPTEVTQIFLPVGDNAAIAAFWTQNDFIVVSDHATPMDASALANTRPFSLVNVQTAGETTLITFHFDGHIPLSLRKLPGGWVLSVSATEDDRQNVGFEPVSRDGGVLYQMPKPGRVIHVTDPSSGADLLVATAAVPVRGPHLARHHVGYEIWPSLQGIVFAVESDQIEVRKSNDGVFLDAVGQDAIPLNVSAAERGLDDSVDWSWLGLRSLSPAMLRENYRRAWTQAALTEPQERGKVRLSAAQAAFALGDAYNARAILATAIEDDPQIITLPDVAFLLAASELLAGNPRGATALDRPDVGVEDNLWRGLYLARTDRQGRTKAASLLAQGFSRLSDYPVPLRDRLRPEVATFIARYGAEADRKELAHLPATPDYDVARAFLHLKTGDREGVLASFEALARNRDPVIAETGREEAIALRRDLKQDTPRATAESYERLILAARLVGRESDVRKATVAAWMQAGQWEKALTEADEEMRLFPDERINMAPQIQDILVNLSEMPSSDARAHTTRAIDVAALIESHVDQLPDSPEKGRILAGLGERMQVLGLPGKAAEAWEQALPLAVDATQRATWGAQLAQADIDAAKLGQARRVLDETEDGASGTDLAARRRVIAATLLMREGNNDQALQMLQQDETDDALDLRGHILEGENRWRDAVAVVGRLAMKNIPKDGELKDDQQALALRLATDAARAADWETLERLRDWIGDRPLTPERQRIFDLFVASSEAGPKTTTEVD